MDWRGIIMDVLATAIIGASGAVVAALITGIFTGTLNLRGIKQRMGDPGNETLAGQHSDLKEGQRQLQQNHTAISASLEKNADLSRAIQLELKMHSERYRLLNEEQRNMDAHVAALQKMSFEMARLQQENHQLKSEKEQLEIKNKNLLQTIYELEQEQSPPVDPMIDIEI